MVASRCSPTMLRALLVLLSLASTAFAGDLDLLDGGVQKWSSGDRVTRCPVHNKIQPEAAADGKGVAFVVNVVSGKRFSLLEKYMPAGGLKSFEGLQINFTSSALGAWKLRLYDGQTNIRFVHLINKPDGVHSLTLPWSAFRAEKTRRCKIDYSTYSIQPSSISHLAIVLPNGPQQAQLTLQSMYAMRDLTAMVVDTPKIAATATAKDDMAKVDTAAVMGSFDGPFVGMGITGHNDFTMMYVGDPAQCAEQCAVTADCRSFDYGARGKVTGECWLSLADRKSAGLAYGAWDLYNYYELKATAPAAAMSKATDNKGAGMSTSPSTFAETTASNAQRLSLTPVACVQAVLALVIFLFS